MTERILVAMDWSWEKDVSRSGVHFGIGHPDGSLRPLDSKTEDVKDVWLNCCRRLAFKIGWGDIVVVHVDSFNHCGRRYFKVTATKNR